MAGSSQCRVIELFADLFQLCLTNANLTGEEQRDCFVTNINRMIRRARRPGPLICAVHERQSESAIMRLVAETMRASDTPRG